MLQCVAVCCSVVYIYDSWGIHSKRELLQCDAECCSVLQSVAECCRVLQRYISMTHGASTASFWGHSSSRSAAPSDNLAELIAQDPNACMNFVLTAGPTSESITAVMRQFFANCVCKEISGEPRMEDLHDVKKKIEADARGNRDNRDKKFHTVCV